MYDGPMYESVILLVGTIKCVLKLEIWFKASFNTDCNYKLILIQISLLYSVHFMILIFRYN